MNDSDQAIALTLPDEKLEVPEGHPLLNKEVMARFEQIADGYRETLRKTRKENLRKAPDALALVGDSINPFSYVRYAFDKNGQLAVGKPKGKRLKPHRTALANLLTFVTSAAVSEEFNRLKVKAEEEGKETQPEIIQPEVLKSLTRAMRTAHQEVRGGMQARRKKRRDQQKRSRKINRKAR